VEGGGGGGGGGEKRKKRKGGKTVLFFHWRTSDKIVIGGEKTGEKGKGEARGAVPPICLKNHLLTGKGEKRGKKKKKKRGGRGGAKTTTP